LWIITSPRLPTLRQWHLARSFPTHSGGSAPVLHRLPYSSLNGTPRTYSCFQKHPSARHRICQRQLAQSMQTALTSVWQAVIISPQSKSGDEPARGWMRSSDQGKWGKCGEKPPLSGNCDAASGLISQVAHSSPFPRPSRKGKGRRRRKTKLPLLPGGGVFVRSSLPPAKGRK
jgi:hypothetical protein